MPQGRPAAVPDDGLTTRQRRQRPLVVVHTGEMKGKHAQTGEGAPVTWHKMGEGWSWIRKADTEADHAADAREGWEQVKRDLAAEAYRFYVLDEFTYPMKWGWVDVGDVVAALARRQARSTWSSPGATPTPG
jgi:cob(I)alamin adenosyltransferase